MLFKNGSARSQSKLRLFSHLWARCFGDGCRLDESAYALQHKVGLSITVIRRCDARHRPGTQLDLMPPLALTPGLQRTEKEMDRTIATVDRVMRHLSIRLGGA